MAEEDELAGSGAELDEEDAEGVGEDDAGEGEEEDEDEDEDEITGNSDCVVEYNRQYWHVPNKAKVRDHNRPHVVASAEVLGEMASSNTTAAKWPNAKDIDPASIVILTGKLKEDDPVAHNVWYLRIVIEGHVNGVDRDILRHIPKGIVKEVLQIMAKDGQLSGSSLVLKYQPTNNNEKVLVPSQKVNNWDLNSNPPKSMAIKPLGAGSKRPAAPTDKENASAPPKKPASSSAAVTTPPTKGDGKKATPPAPKKAPAGGSSSKAVPKATVPAPAMAPKASSNPFDKSKQVKAVPPLAPRESGVVGEAVEEEPTATIVDPETNAFMSAADALAPCTPQDREIESTVKHLLQVRGGRDETPRANESMNRTFEWVCKSRETGACSVQKVVVPEWVKSYTLTLKMSSDAQQ